MSVLPSRELKTRNVPGNITVQVRITPWRKHLIKMVSGCVVKYETVASSITRLHGQFVMYLRSVIAEFSLSILCGHSIIKPAQVKCAVHQTADLGKRYARCSDTYLHVETLIEQPLIPDDGLAVTSESIQDKRSEKGFACKAEQTGCGSSPVPDPKDPAQTTMSHRGRCWTCYTRTKVSKEVKGVAVLVTATIRHATRERHRSSKRAQPMARLRTAAIRSLWNDGEAESNVKALSGNRYSSESPAWRHVTNER